MTGWRERLKRGFGALSTRLPSLASAEAEARAPETILILCDDRLVDPLGARAEPLTERTPEAVARAARKLVTGDRPNVTLALPGHEFLAVSLEMPGLSHEQLHGAIQLQLPELLPGVEQPMMLEVVTPPPGGGGVLAVWLPAARGEALFHAFEVHGLFLAAITPRPALYPPGDDRRWRCEEEGGFLTCTEWGDGRIVRWITTAVEDLEVEALREQWRECLGGEEPEPLGGDDGWLDTPPAAAPVALVPHGARLRIADDARRRRRRIQFAAAAAVTVVVLVVWGVLAGRMIYFERKLDRLMVAAEEASRLRGEVVEIETRLAPIVDFPVQDVGGVLQLLNQRIPRDSWIERMQLDEGVVELEGYSPDPAKLVALLAEDRRFEEVAFSRATRGDGRQGERFGIRFRLVGVDVQAYLQEHFPVER